MIDFEALEHRRRVMSCYHRIRQMKRVCRRHRLSTKERQAVLVLVLSLKLKALAFEVRFSISEKYKVY
jgi:hypothetical protein